MKGLLFAVALAALSVASAAEKKLIRVGYPAAGTTTLTLLEDRQRIVFANFLTDAFKRADGIAAVNEKRSRSIFGRIRSGAVDYGTDDLQAIYSSYLPVDVVIDFSADNDLETVTAAIYWKGARKSFTAGKVTRFRLHEICGRLVSLIEECPVFSDAQKKSVRSLWKERKNIFYAYYFTPNLRGHYCDNTGEAKWDCALAAFSAEKGQGPMASRICDAGHDAMFDTRACVKLSKIKAGKMAALAFINALGTGEDDMIRKMAVHYPGHVEKDTLALARKICGDQESMMLDDVLKTGAEDEMDEQLADMDMDKGVEGGITADAAKFRRALVACGWMNTGAGWKMLEDGAKAGEVLTRIAAAEGMASATNAASLATLAKLAADKDPALSATASLSLVLRGAKPPASAAAKARAIAGNRLYTRAALETLVAVGGREDLALFEKHRLDADTAIRNAAVAGIATHDPATPSMNDLFNDADDTVVARVLSIVGRKGIRKGDAHYDRFVVFANDASPLVSDAARAALEVFKPASGDALVEYELALEHPYIRRKILEEAAAKGDEKSKALLEKTLSNENAQMRALALGLLFALDPARAYPHAVKAAGEAHGWVRFHAALLLARSAKKEDAEKIRAFLAKEKMRGTKLYFEDALAKAEGRPAPPPRKSVNSIYPKDKRALMWGGSTGGDFSSNGPYDAFYTCAMPQWTEDIQRGHDAGRIYYPRPTPIGDPALILTDVAAGDTFWTELLKQMTDKITDVTDGVVYGEESMYIDVGQGAFDKAWRLFCREAGLDMKRVAGSLSNLTPVEKEAWTRWITVTGTDGFNILYDFTKDYFGKIRPGFGVCTWMADTGASEVMHMKFDLTGAYIYDGDFRNMYSHVRKLKTLFPERPLQWASFGVVNTGRGGSIDFDPILWNTPWPTKPVRYRFDHTYSDNFAAWFAGADPGFFIMYATEREGVSGCCWMEFPIMHIYNHPKTHSAVDFAFEDSYGKISDMMKDSVKKEVDVSMEESAGGDLEGLTLEEEGSKNDPVVKKQEALKEAMRRGFVFVARGVRDAAMVQHSLPRRWPGRTEAAIVNEGRLPYTPAGLALAEFDVYHDFDVAAKLGTLGSYKVIVTGGKRKMTDSTRKALLSLLKENRLAFIVCGTYPDTKGGAKATVRSLKSDLDDPWPWEDEVKYVPAAPKRGILPHYAVKQGADVDVIESNKSGPTRLVWRGKGVKSLVVFDLEKGAAKSKGVSDLVSKYFAANGVKFRFAEMPGLFKAGTGNGLEIAVMSAAGLGELTLPGCDLLTGQWNAKVTTGIKAAASAEEYVSPYVVINGGVSVLAMDFPLKVLEKLPNGVKVEVDGLVRVATRSRRPAKIAGAPLREVKDAVEFFVKGGNGGIATLKASNAPEIISTKGRIDNIPDVRIFRAKGAFTITDE